MSVSARGPYLPALPGVDRPPYCYAVAGSGQSTGQRSRFPALDPEPPPRPLWQRLAVPGAVLVAAGVVVTALVLWPSSQRAHRPAALAGLASGSIVAVTPSGGLALSDAGSGRVTRPRGLDNVGDMVAVSPGNRYLALFNGQVVIVRPGPALAPYPAKVPLSSETTAAWPGPFADHSRALVMLKDYGTLASSDSPASVVSMATGHQIPLGSGDHVAGDPQAPGAFVAVPAPAQASAASAQAQSGFQDRVAGRGSGPGAARHRRRSQPRARAARWHCGVAGRVSGPPREPRSR